MRRLAPLCSLLLVGGCALPSASRDGYPCRSDEDCATSLGYACVHEPGADTSRCAAVGSLPHGDRPDGGDDGSDDGGAPPDDAGPAVRDSGLPGVDGGHGGDAGETPMDGGGLDAGPALFFGGYVARLPLTVPAGRVQGEAALEDFPLYVTLMHDELRSVSAGGQVRSPDGDDLELRRSGEDTPLAHELVSYQPSTGEVALFVRVPLLSATSDNVVYVYFGSDEVSEPPTARPEDVWEPGFRAVWHLDEIATNGDVRDSTDQNHGRARNLDDDDVRGGVLGGAVDFEQTNQAIHVESTDLDRSGTLTVEAWARLDGDTQHDFPRIYQKGTSAVGRSVELMVNTSFQGATVIFRTTFNTNGHSPQYDMPAFQYGEWHHYVGVFDDEADEIRIYLDGQRVVTEPQPLTVRTGLSDHWIGNWNASTGDTRHWEGRIDEVRISSVARSDAWIAASHENQLAPAAFYDVGDVETP